MIRVLLNVGSPALRAGLKALLASDRAIQVDTWDEQSAADVIITSAATASNFHHELDSARSASLLILSDDPVDSSELRPGSRAWGILPTEASAEELVAAIHALAQGLIVGAPHLLFEREHEPAEQGPLSERELEVLSYLAKGLANKQIAVALGISEHTVKFHVSSIYNKLDVTNRTEAVRAGLRGGWIAL